jgi:hypothetical protein
MKKITENELKNKVSRLREYLAVIEAATPGMGQKGPTVAAAQGADPSNPLNQAPYNAAKDSQAANVPAAQSTKPATAWPTDKNAIIAFQKANGLTPDGMIGAKTMGALQAAGAQPPAGFRPVGNRPAQSTKPATAAPAAAPMTQTQQNFAAAGMAGQEMRTQAEIDASADMLSANDGTGQNGGAEQARNPNAGLTPDDSRWQGPKPSAATGVGNPGEEAAADADFLKRQRETNAQTAADTQATKEKEYADNADLADAEMGKAMALNAAAATPATSVTASAPAVTNPTDARLAAGTQTAPTAPAAAPAATAAAPAAAPAATAQSTKPAGAPNPWEGKDPAKAAAFAKLSPEDQKWLGGADPTDQYILARAPKKGKPVQESTSYDEIQRLVSLVQYR